MASKGHRNRFNGSKKPAWGVFRFTRYDEPADFERWHAMALASVAPPSETYVLGIDCADRWLFKRWGVKLVLTNERILAFSPNPAAPIERTYWLEDITDVKYDTGMITADLRLLGADFYEAYSVPKGLGREFAEAVRTRLEEN